MKFQICSNFTMRNPSNQLEFQSAISTEAITQALALRLVAATDSTASQSCCRAAVAVADREFLRIRIVMLFEVTPSGQVQCKHVKFHCFGMSQVGAVVCWLVLQICCAAYLQQQFQHRAQVLSTSIKRSVKTVPKWREDLYVTRQYTSCFPTQTCTNRTCTWNTCPGIQVGLGISSFRSSKPLRTKFPAQVPGRHHNVAVKRFDSMSKRFWKRVSVSLFHRLTMSHLPQIPHSLTFCANSPCTSFVDS